MKIKNKMNKCLKRLIKLQKIIKMMLMINYQHIINKNKKKILIYLNKDLNNLKMNYNYYKVVIHNLNNK